MKRVGVFGLPCVGLPVSTVLARCGYRVSVVDVTRSMSTNVGCVDIVEPDLDMPVEAAG